jgi:hypothetical protein
MAMVINNAHFASIMDEKLKVSDPTKTTFQHNGQDAFDVYVYAPTEEFTEGATLIMVKKAFCNYAQACGAKGAMTAAMIKDTFANVPDAVADTLAADFAVAYGNYVIIPDTVQLAITVPPIQSISELMIEE